MKLIRSPDTQPLSNWKSIFLAGGISNCEDWQMELTDYLSDLNVTIVNPRRVGDLATTGEETKKQIEWEFNYLRRCSVVSFWFPKTSICPITLFELGRVLGTYIQDNITVIIGCDPEYTRLFDVQQQSGLEGCEVIIGKDMFFKEVRNALENLNPAFLE